MEEKFKVPTNVEELNFELGKLYAGLLNGECEVYKSDVAQKIADKINRNNLNMILRKRLPSDVGVIPFFDVIT